MIDQQALELLAGVLAALVGMMQRQITMIKASVTSCALMLAFIDQPTTQRENRSMTTAT
jgi:hypothetical protein